MVGIKKLRSTSILIIEPWSGLGGSSFTILGGKSSFFCCNKLKHFLKDLTGQLLVPAATIIPPSKELSFSRWFFVISSKIFSIYSPFLRCLITKSAFLSSPKFSRPRQERNNIISQNTLHCNEFGLLSLKTSLWYSHFMSSLHTETLCSTILPTHSFFKQTNWAWNSLLDKVILYKQ